VNCPETLGFVGTGLVAAAYIPQIHHLIKEHCSAGISVKAYVLWFIASVFFVIHAPMIIDAVFIGVQLVNLLAISIILVFARKYEKQICQTHLATQLGLSNSLASGGCLVSASQTRKLQPPLSLHRR
jgi:uncharacterized protein with PQ loop repeat